MTKIEITTTSEQETKRIAIALARFLNPSDVITLEGDLGSGKTTFTKGLADGLEVKRNVTSPTFTIIKEYMGRIPLYHMDVYRLEYSDEDIGFEEYFYGDGVTIVEWASFIHDYIPKKRLSITISVLNETKRQIIFESNSRYYDDILQQLQQTIEI